MRRHPAPNCPELARAQHGFGRFVLETLALGALALVVACGGASSGGTTAPSAGGTTGSALGTGDSFEARVYGEDGLSGTYQVGEDGGVDFPFVGRVKVAGLEPAQVADLLEHKLQEGGFLKSPDVSVLVKEYASKRISVLGAVKNPGAFPLTNNLTVVQAISLAGGFSSLANRDETVVSRRVGGELKRIRVAVDDVTAARSEDLQLQAGDIVYVPERIF